MCVCRTFYLSLLNIYIHTNRNNTFFNDILVSEGRQKQIPVLLVLWEMETTVTAFYRQYTILDTICCPRHFTKNNGQVVSAKLCFRKTISEMSIFLFFLSKAQSFVTCHGNRLDDICVLHFFTHKPSRQRKHLPSVTCANPTKPPHLLCLSLASSLSITTCVLCNADGAGRCLNPLCLYLTHTCTHAT